KLSSPAVQQLWTLYPGKQTERSEEQMEPRVTQELLPPESASLPQLELLLSQFKWFWIRCFVRFRHDAFADIPMCSNFQSLPTD
ncbi:hypothetical protein Tco_0934765, partial [Tanacetum coccineum]